MQAEHEFGKCPFCGNTAREEFAVRYEDRGIGVIKHRVYNARCSCGAAGPDADTPEGPVTPE
jgi:hypothetical protein